MARNFLDGSSQRFTVASILSGRSTFTIAARAQRSSTGGALYGPLIGEGVSSVDRMYIQFWTDGVVYMSFDSGNWGNFTSNDLSDHGLVVRYDGGQSTNATKLRAWLDGVEQSLSYTGTIPTTSGGASNSLEIGHDSTNGIYSEATMSEVAVWSSALAAEQCVSLSSKIFAPSHVPIGLLAYWPMHGRAGASGGEVAWFGSNLTQTNSPAVVAHPRITYPVRRLMRRMEAGAAPPTRTALNTRAAALGDRVAMGWRIHD